MEELDKSKFVYLRSHGVFYSERLLEETLLEETLTNDNSDETTGEAECQTEF